MSETQKLNVVIVGVDGTPHQETWTSTTSRDTLAWLQDTVGGLVDVVALTDTIDMWLNDEGIYQCEPNPAATLLAADLSGHGVHQMFYGPAVFTGGCDEDGTTLGLSAPAAAAVFSGPAKGLNGRR